jgi:uncharacterized membrane protein YjdF
MKKTLLFNILTLSVLLLTSYSTLASPTIAAWFGVISSAITILLNTTYTTSGTWVASGWTYSQWAVAISNIVLNVGAMVTASALIPVEVVNYITIAATIMLQYFGKVYKKD